jgi:hydroxyacylglutathione hydrolase
MTAWRAEGRPVERIELIDPDQLADRLDGRDGPTVLDVRRDSEWTEGHIPGSIHVPYDQLPKRLPELPEDRPLATICTSGKRSGLAASILQREGLSPIIHVAHGGVGTWRRSGGPIEEGD